MTTPYTDLGGWEFDVATNQMVRRGEPGLLSTDASGNTVLVGADGDPLLTVEEPSKNIIANVNHRTGTLAALLALDGGNGEISVATDTLALVRHTGVIGEAVPFYSSGAFTEIFTQGAINQSIATATDTPIQMILGQRIDPLGAFVSSTEMLFSGLAASEKVGVAFAARQTFGASAAGTTRELALQAEVFSGVWLDVSSIRTTVAAAATALLVANAPVMMVDANASGALKMRVVARQDSGSAMTLGVGLFRLSVFRQP